MKCHVLLWMFSVCALWEELLMHDMEVIVLESRTFHTQISKVQLLLSSLHIAAVSVVQAILCIRGWFF